EMKLRNILLISLAYLAERLEVYQQSNCNVFNNISPSKDHWLSAGSGVSGCSYQMYYQQKEIVVLVYMSRATAEENKFLFDFLYERKEQIEAAFGAQETLAWDRLDNRKAGS